jgi:hypothetical protein
MAGLRKQNGWTVSAVVFSSIFAPAAPQCRRNEALP